MCTPGILLHAPGDNSDISSFWSKFISKKSHVTTFSSVFVSPSTSAFSSQALSTWNAMKVCSPAAARDKRSHNNGRQWDSSIYRFWSVVVNKNGITSGKFWSLVVNKYGMMASGKRLVTCSKTKTG